MSYLDRLQRMTYTGPSGSAFNLRFRSVSRDVGKKAPVSEFPGQNQGAVQDLGQTTPRYPVECFLDGANYDLAADRFWSELNRSGPGTLDHPRWGRIRVLPVSVSQSEQFVDGAGRASFSIDFVRAETEQFEYPTSLRGGPEGVTAAVDAAGVQIAGAVDGETLTDLGEKAAVKDTILGALDSVTEGFDRITAATDETRSNIRNTVLEIENTVDSLVSAPVDLVTSMLSLYRLPADTVDNVGAKIDGYSGILDTVVTSFSATTGRYGDLFGLIGATQVQSLLVSASEAASYGTAATRADGVDGVTGLQGLIDTGLAALDSFAPGEYAATQATRAALSAAINALINRTLNLPTERIYTAERDITPLELAYELYADRLPIEDAVDRLIEYNQLTGASIILIPSGTEVRWYE